MRMSIHDKHQHAHARTSYVERVCKILRMAFVEASKSPIKLKGEVFLVGHVSIFFVLHIAESRAWYIFCTRVWSVWSDAGKISASSSICKIG